MNAEELRQHLHYDPATGIFRWISNNLHLTESIKRRNAGSVHASGYRRIKVDGTLYTATHLAYLYMENEWPPEGSQMDHINRDKDDNRYENLRAVSPTTNARNKRIYNNNTSGHKSIHINHKRVRGPTYTVRITYNHKKIFVGTYKTVEAAVEARDETLRTIEDR